MKTDRHNENSGEQNVRKEENDEVFQRNFEQNMSPLSPETWDATNYLACLTFSEVFLICM